MPCITFGTQQYTRYTAEIQISLCEYEINATKTSGLLSSLRAVPDPLDPDSC